MKKLYDIQRNFKNTLLYGKGDIYNSLKSYNVSTDNRLWVYQNGLYNTYYFVLDVSYPTVKSVLGKELFEELVSEYLSYSFSKSGNLDEFGEEFPEFLKITTLLREYNHLYDIAKLEFALYKSELLSANNKDVSQNGSIDIFHIKDLNLKEENLLKAKLLLHASTHLVKMHYKAVDVYNEHNSNDPIISSHIGEEDLYFLIVSIDKYNIKRVIELNKLEYCFLSLTEKNNDSIFENYINVSMNANTNELNLSDIIHKLLSLGGRLTN